MCGFRVFAVVVRHRDAIKLIDHDGLVSATQIGPVRFVEAGRLLEILFRDVEEHFVPIVAEPQRVPRDSNVFIAHTEEASVIEDGITNVVIHRINHEVFNVAEFFAISALVEEAFRDLLRKANLSDRFPLQSFGDIRENIFYCLTT
jgi:hypothetical protein